MSVLKRISSFIVQKLLPIKYKVWLLETLACDIASQGEDGDTELAHINSYEAKLLKSVGGSGTINSKTGLKMYGSGGGSAPAAPAQNTVVEKAEFPPELRPYITDILSKAQAQEESRLAGGYPLYPGPRIAPFTTEELAAREGIKSLVGSSQPGFDVAKGLTAAGTGTATASDIARGMSPYMQNVVDVEKREAQRAAEPLQQQIAAQAIGSQGAFGGSRQAILEAEANRNLQQQLGDIQTRGQQAAFTEAQRAFEAQKQRQLAGGQQYANIVPQQQGLAFKELGALAGVGEQDRDQTQKALDLGFQEFREQQTYPEASLQQYQSIIRGFPMNPTTTQTQQSILPTPSLGQQLIGAGATAVGLGQAGMIPKIFEEGGSLKQIPEDNTGLQALAKKSPDTVKKMGFKTLKRGKRISKQENNMYKKMLMDLLVKSNEGTDVNPNVITAQDGMSLLEKMRLKNKEIQDMPYNALRPYVTPLYEDIKTGITSPFESLKVNPIVKSLGRIGGGLSNLYDKGKGSLDSFLDGLDLDSFVENQNNALGYPNFNEEEFKERQKEGIKRRQEQSNKKKNEVETILNDGKDIIKNTTTSNKFPGVIMKKDGTVDLPGEPGTIVKVGTKSKPIPNLDNITKTNNDETNIAKEEKEQGEIIAASQETAKTYLDDVIEKSENESKEEFDSRKGFAIAKFGLALMGGTPIFKAGDAAIDNLTAIEKDKLKAKNRLIDLKITRDREKVLDKRYDRKVSDDDKKFKKEFKLEERKLEEVDKPKAEATQKYYKYLSDNKDKKNNNFDTSMLSVIAEGEGLTLTDPLDTEKTIKGAPTILHNIRLVAEAIKKEAQRLDKDKTDYQILTEAAKQVKKRIGPLQKLGDKYFDFEDERYEYNLDNLKPL